LPIIFMSKKTIYLIILFSLAVFLILAGLLIFFNSSKQAPVISNQPQPVINNKPAVSSPAPKQGTSTIAIPAGDYPLANAEKTGSSSECLKISDKKSQTLCISLLASYLQNSDVCANIKDATSSQRCIDEANMQAAVKGNKISLCLKIKAADLNYSCIINVMGEMKDLTTADCNTLPDKEKSYCLQDLAFRNVKVKADCQGIADKVLQKKCLGFFANQ
jgi:hypothetical protein